MHSAAATAMQAPSVGTNTYTADFQHEEDVTLLKVDLSGIELPKVDNLHVDGLQRSWWARLFGK